MTAEGLPWLRNAMLHAGHQLQQPKCKETHTIQDGSDEGFGVLIHLLLVALWPKHLVILVLLAGGGARLLNGHLQVTIGLQTTSLCSAVTDRVTLVHARCLLCTRRNCCLAQPYARTHLQICMNDCRQCPSYQLLHLGHVAGATLLLYSFTMQFIR